MIQSRDPAYAVLWNEDLEEVDREIARLTTICQVRILEPGVIRRALQKVVSICGTQNPAGFAKLHDLLMLHLAIRQKSVNSFGQARTTAVEDDVIERLAKAYPDLAAARPPAS